MIPVTIHRYAYGATFWRKSKPSTTGIWADDLPNELRQQLQRNTGLLVRVVVDDSPGFRANILPGDVLTAINDEQLMSASRWRDTSARYAGQKVTLHILRNGVEKEIPMEFNLAPSVDQKTAAPLMRLD